VSLLFSGLTKWGKEQLDAFSSFTHARTHTHTHTHTHTEREREREAYDQWWRSLFPEMLFDVPSLLQSNRGGSFPFWTLPQSLRPVFLYCVYLSGCYSVSGQVYRRWGGDAKAFGTHLNFFTCPLLRLLLLLSFRFVAKEKNRREAMNVCCLPFFFFSALCEFGLPLQLGASEQRRQWRDEGGRRGFLCHIFPSV